MTSLKNLSKEQVIAEVRRHEILYNKSLKEYNEGDTRESVWIAIAEKLNFRDVGEVKKQWKSLRDTYTRHKREYYKNKASSAETGVAPCVRWKYWKNMQFLKNHTMNRGTGDETTHYSDDDDEDEDNNIVDEEDNGETTEIQSQTSQIESNQLTNDYMQSLKATYGMTEEALSAYMDHDLVDAKPVPMVGTLVQASAKRRKRSIPIKTDRVMGFINPTRPTAVKLEEPPDADKLFLLSLHPSLQQLNPQTKSTLKIKIQQLLHDAEFPPAITEERVIAEVEPETVTVQLQ